MSTLWHVYHTEEEFDARVANPRRYTNTFYTLYRVWRTIQEDLEADPVRVALYATTLKVTRLDGFGWIKSKTYGYADIIRRYKRYEKEHTLQ